MAIGLKVHTHVKLECLVVKVLDTSRGADHLDMLKYRGRGREGEREERGGGIRELTFWEEGKTIIRW